MSAYYNDSDPRACAWLRELIAAGLIAPGDIDERSIADVRPEDLRGYKQVHMFAGIGGWSYALRLAGLPDDYPVWTGSCPCQPFSIAGRGRATRDERHLWPEFARLIRECRPAAVVGEQVAGELGLQWLAGVFADLERSGYAVAGADLCAACVGAPHIRQRLYWVGIADGAGWEQGWLAAARSRHRCATESTGSTYWVALSEQQEDSRRRIQRPGESSRATKERPSGGLEGSGPAFGLAFSQHPERREESEWRSDHNRHDARRDQTAGGLTACGTLCGSWSDFELIPCGDGKARRIESGTFPLVDGFPERVGLLRGYGNAIVPQVAAAFLRAALFAGGEVTL